MDFIVTRSNDDPNNSLKHWKYIRREYDYGKRRYRYYYANTSSDTVAESENYKPNIFVKAKYRLKDAIGYDEKSAYNTAKNTYKLDKDSADYRYATAERIEKEVAQKGTMTVGDKTAIKLAREGGDYYSSGLEDLKKLVNQTYAEYTKTPLYKIERASEKINNAKNKVTKLLKRLSKK